jgi:hypothetical protein
VELDSICKAEIGPVNLRLILFLAGLPISQFHFKVGEVCIRILKFKIVNSLCSSFIKIFSRVKHGFGSKVLHDHFLMPPK